MTYEEALARFAARWDHPPLDPRDVQERIALRYRESVTPRTHAVVAAPPVCRLCVLLEDHPDIRRRKWTSLYVHTTNDVDRALDELDARLETRGRKAA